jgi:hypothetical protein
MPLWTGQPLAYPTVQKTGAAAVGQVNYAFTTIRSARLTQTECKYRSLHFFINWCAASKNSP